MREKIKPIVGGTVSYTTSKNKKPMVQARDQQSIPSPASTSWAKK
jgi:hypothetical protein